MCSRNGSFCFLTLVLIALLSSCPNPGNLPSNAVPESAVPGDTVKVSFCVSEILPDDPVVSLGGTPMSFLSWNEGTYSFSYVVDGSEAEGIVPLEITMTDAAGNIGFVTQPEAVRFASSGSGREIPSTSRAQIDGVITSLAASPSLVRAGNVLTVTFQTTQSCIPYLTVTVGAATMVFSSISFGSYTYVYTILGTDAEGQQSIEVQVETTGGDTDREILANAVEYDFTDPIAESLIAAPTVAGSGTRIAATFRTSETCSGYPKVYLGDKEMTFDSLSFGLYTYTYNVTGGETEGVQDISVYMEDLAGNTGSGVLPAAVVLDFSPAVISDFSTSPGYARCDIPVTVNFQVNEICAGDPIVTLGDSIMSMISFSFGKYTYVHTLV